MKKKETTSSIYIPPPPYPPPPLKSNNNGTTRRGSSSSSKRATRKIMIVKYRQSHSIKELRKMAEKDGSLDNMCFWNSQGSSNGVNFDGKPCEDNPPLYESSDGMPGVEGNHEKSAEASSYTYSSSSEISNADSSDSSCCSSCDSGSTISSRGSDGSGKNSDCENSRDSSAKAEEDDFSSQGSSPTSPLAPFPSGAFARKRKSSLLKQKRQKHHLNVNDDDSGAEEYTFRLSVRSLSSAEVSSILSDGTESVSKSLLGENRGDSTQPVSKQLVNSRRPPSTSGGRSGLSNFQQPIITAEESSSSSSSSSADSSSFSSDSSMKVLNIRDRNTSRPERPNFVVQKPLHKKGSEAQNSPKGSLLVLGSKKARDRSSVLTQINSVLSAKDAQDFSIMLIKQEEELEKQRQSKKYGKSSEEENSSPSNKKVIIPLGGAPESLPLLPGEAMLLHINAWIQKHSCRPGTLYFTTYRIIFNDVVPLSKSGDEEYEEFPIAQHQTRAKVPETSSSVSFLSGMSSTSTQDPGPISVPYTSVDDASWTAKQGSKVLTITTKDFRKIKLMFIPEDGSCDMVETIIKSYIFPGVVSYVFAFSYEQQYFSENGWKLYNPRGEFNRLGIPDSSWRISDINIRYKLCDTYPGVLVFPSVSTDDNIREAASYRNLARIPTFCWRNNVNKAALLRSAHHIKPGSPSSSSSSSSSNRFDSDFIDTIRLATKNADSKVVIIDLKPK